MIALKCLNHTKKLNEVLFRFEGLFYGCKFAVLDIKPKWKELIKR